MISRLIFASFAATKFCSSTSEMTEDLSVASPGSVIWNTASTQADLGWYALDDGVMGGVSKTNLPPGTKFTGDWNGHVSTANNGGFAGIRTRVFSPLIDASSCGGFLLSVIGDGQRYKFVARDNVAWDGVAWSTSFDTTAGEQIEVKVPFNKLIPTRRASTVKSAAPLNTGGLTDVQMTISKFEYDGGLNPSFKEGPFRLELKQISLF